MRGCGDKVERRDALERKEQTTEKGSQLQSRYHDRLSSGLRRPGDCSIRCYSILGGLCELYLSLEIFFSSN